MFYWKIISAALALVFGLSKAYGIFSLRRETNAQRIFDALTVGIHAAWEQVVKPWMLENADTEKLPQEIRDAAEQKAITTAATVDPIIKKTPRRILRASLKRALEESKRIGGV